MPDRDRAAAYARNQRTYLAARLPAGLKPLVYALAELAGEPVSTLVAAALEREIKRRITAGTVTRDDLDRGAAAWLARITAGKETGT